MLDPAVSCILVGASATAGRLLSSADDDKEDGTEEADDSPESDIACKDCMKIGGHDAMAPAILVTWVSGIQQEPSSCRRDSATSQVEMIPRGIV